MTKRGMPAVAAVLLAAWLGGCAMTDDTNVGDDQDGASEDITGEVDVASQPAPPPEKELPDWRRMWDFGNAAASRARFEEALAAGQEARDREYVLIVTTQIARTHGLERNFDRAHEILDGVEAQLDGASAEVRMRYLLERGRATNSSGDPAGSAPFFEQAWDIGIASGEDLLAVDAAHMLAIVLPAEEQLSWSEKAMKLAEDSADERCKGWLGPLYNNTGWTYHDMGDYDRALDLWEKSLAFRQDQGAPEPVFIARWTIARCWRSMGRYQDALAEQKSVLDDRAAAGIPSPGYCEEEIAENLVALGRADEAKDWFGKAYDLLKDDKWMQADHPERLARMKELGGR